MAKLLNSHGNTSLELCKYYVNVSVSVEFISGQSYFVRCDVPTDARTAFCASVVLAGKLGI